MDSLPLRSLVPCESLYPNVLYDTICIYTLFVFKLLIHACVCVLPHSTSYETCLETNKCYWWTRPLFFFFGNWEVSCVRSLISLMLILCTLSFYKTLIINLMLCTISLTSLTRSGLMYHHIRKIFSLPYIRTLSISEQWNGLSLSLLSSSLWSSIWT